MNTEKKRYGLFVAIGILLIIFVPIVVDYIGRKKIDTILYDDVMEKIGLKESFVLYNGELDSKTMDGLIEIRDRKLEDNSIEYSVYNVNSSDLKKKVYIYIEGDLQKEYDSYNYKELGLDVDTFLIGKNIDKNKSYKVAEGFKEYKKIVNSDKVVMSVFGRNSCSWCNKFKPIYNALAYKYDLDIYYFDSDSYDESEYKRIINMSLVIPAKCNNTGSDFKLSDGFGTPLTIFTKKGEVVDCISGYTSRSALLEKLKTNEMISE